MHFNRKLHIAALLIVFFLLLGGKAEAKTHTVKPGDSLYSLSQSTGIPVDKLKKNNTLYSDSITAEQVLIIPEKYIVKPGDTLYFISQNFGISVWE
ncbi:MAG: LysM peptidoglycan-binding domain-containing protein, partial [Tepidanaerobacteraceae bacterium]|nr:LysM peptidoglycan-binding domain-containing protein [Tepidanaerobacteraceae bacterium]